METVLRAPFRARVRECPVSVGSQVEAGAPLMRLEPLAARQRPRQCRRERPAASAAGQASAEIDLPAEPSDARRRACRRGTCGDLRGLLLGFDGDAEDRKRLLSGYLAARAEPGGQPVPGRRSC